MRPLDDLALSFASVEPPRRPDDADRDMVVDYGGSEPVRVDMAFYGLKVSHMISDIKMGLGIFSPLLRLRPAGCAREVER